MRAFLRRVKDLKQSTRRNPPGNAFFANRRGMVVARFLSFPNEIWLEIEPLSAANQARRYQKFG